MSLRASFGGAPSPPYTILGIEAKNPRGALRRRSILAVQDAERGIHSSPIRFGESDLDECPAHAVGANESGSLDRLGY